MQLPTCTDMSAHQKEPDVGVSFVLLDNCRTGARITPADGKAGRGQLDRPERLLFNFIATSPELELKWRKKMDCVLFVVIVNTSMTDKAINSSNVPMATQQLCNAAKPN
jgi:hypothetical protein